MRTFEDFYPKRPDKEEERDPGTREIAGGMGLEGLMHGYDELSGSARTVDTHTFPDPEPTTPSALQVPGQTAEQRVEQYFPSPSTLLQAAEYARSLVTAATGGLSRLVTSIREHGLPGEGFCGSRSNEK